MIYTEDPAISMARKTLFANNPVYNTPEIKEDIFMPRVMTTKCVACGKLVKLKGTFFIKTSSGKKEFYCDDCKPHQESIVNKEITAPSDDTKKRTCFFCDNILFYINTNGSIECTQCRATFKKGEMS